MPPGTLVFVSNSKIVGKAKFGRDGHYFTIGLPPGELGVAIVFGPPSDRLAERVASKGAVRLPKKANPSLAMGAGRTAQPSSGTSKSEIEREIDLGKAISAVHGNVSVPVHRITVAPEPIEQKIDINFVGP